MAWLERTDDGPYKVAFRFAGERYKVSLGTTDLKQAQGRQRRLEENIELVKNGRLTLPDDVEIDKFLISDGKLDGKPVPKQKLRTLSQYKKAFLASIPAGSLEEKTLSGMDTHFKHILRILGKSFLLRALSLEDLQSYVDTRAKDPGSRGRTLSPSTTKKELSTFRTLWNWAKHAGYLTRPFPSRGLRYPKGQDKPPFQTWAEIIRKIEFYNPSAEQIADLWECLFLTKAELDELLSEVKQTASLPCIYPMFVFAAHTGARRSEILRSLVEDIDLMNRTITIREKKRVRGRNTTRTVPMSQTLHDVMYKWLSTQGRYGPTFSMGLEAERTNKTRKEIVPLARDEARHHFKLSLADTKWSPIRGWHVFRHSFCSNCAAAGIDQRIINAWVGHQTEEMVKRYRHLIPLNSRKPLPKSLEIMLRQLMDRLPYPPIPVEFSRCISTDALELTLRHHVSPHDTGCSILVAI